MSGLYFENDWKGQLNAGINATQTNLIDIEKATGETRDFPFAEVTATGTNDNGGILTLYKSDESAREIIYVDSAVEVTPGTLWRISNCIRGIDGSTGLTWLAGDLISFRFVRLLAKFVNRGVRWGCNRNFGLSGSITVDVSQTSSVTLRCFGDMTIDIETTNLNSELLDTLGSNNNLVKYFDIWVRNEDTVSHNVTWAATFNWTQGGGTPALALAAGDTIHVRGTYNIGFGSTNFFASHERFSVI